MVFFPLENGNNRLFHPSIRFLSGNTLADYMQVSAFYRAFLRFSLEIKTSRRKLATIVVEISEKPANAKVAELADAPDLGSGG